MNGQYTMFGPTTSRDTGNATFSPASECGLTPCVSPDGLTNGKYGPDLVPVNPSLTPERRKRSTTRGIYGQSGFFSSEHDDLSYALANRLRAQTDSLGSMLFTLTWVTRVTPAGLSISALRASEPPTGGNGFSSWGNASFAATTLRADVGIERRGTDYMACDQASNAANFGRMADTEDAKRRAEYGENGSAHGRNGSGRRGDVGIMADASGTELETRIGGMGLQRGENGAARSSAQSDGADVVMVHNDGERREERPEPDGGTDESGLGASRRGDALRCGDDGGMADTDKSEPGAERGNAGEVPTASQGQIRQGLASALPGERRANGGMADTAGRRLGRGSGRPAESESASSQERSPGCLEALGDTGSESRRPGPLNGFWRDADWIFCRDRKWRPVEAGTFPLAHGASARVGRLRGYGDAINAEVAGEFIRAYTDISERS